LFTGIILKNYGEFKIYKKIKLKGNIFKIHQKTAFIKNMFNQELDIIRFIGSIIKGKCGEKGIIKKPVNFGPPGSFRAVFEKKIGKKTKVYLKVFIPIKFYFKIFDVNFLLIPNDFKEIKSII
jgi:ribosome biogenesis protein BMS1